MLAEMRLKEWVKAQEGLKPLGEAQVGDIVMCISTGFVGWVPRTQYKG